MVNRPQCTFCEEARAAQFVAAQSTDQGKTVSWVFVCNGHADGWNDGGDWDAPIVPLGGGATQVEQQAYGRPR